MIAIREAWAAGLLRKENLPKNILAGIVVGVVSLPLAMAFAIASGAAPAQGLYTGLVAGLCVSLFGGSRVQIAGPTGAFIILLADITARHGIVGLQIATMMAGVILLALGLSRLGGIIKFIPDPVIIGFTSGIAVVIFVGQWKDFLGLSPALGGKHFHHKIIALAEAMPNAHLETAVIGLTALLIVLVTPRVKYLRTVPGPLVALVAATVLCWRFAPAGVATVGGAFGGVPAGFPPIGLPEVTMTRLVELVGPAFAIAMLGAIESLLSAVVADGMAGTHHDSNQELVGQGIANIASPIFGGFAATGAIARTATNVRYGGNSPVAGVVHSLTILLTLLVLAPLASHVPLTALAAILFVVAWNMSEAERFAFMLRKAPKSDIAVLLITFSLTVLADLVIAVNIGVIIATLLFMRRMASAVEVQKMTEKELAHELAEGGMTRLPAGVMVYSIEGPFFFGAVQSLERALVHTHTDPHALVLRLKHVPFVDITGIEALSDAIDHLRRRKVDVFLCEMNGRVSGKLAKAGLLDKLGDGFHADDFQTAIGFASTLSQVGKKGATQGA